MPHPQSATPPETQRQLLPPPPSPRHLWSLLRAGSHRSTRMKPTKWGMPSSPHGLRQRPSCPTSSSMPTRHLRSHLLQTPEPPGLLLLLPAHLHLHGCCHFLGLLLGQSLLLGLQSPSIPAPYSSPPHSALQSGSQNCDGHPMPLKPGSFRTGQGRGPGGLSCPRAPAHPLAKGCC